MAELARWSLKVSRDTDVALRTLLAMRGGRKGDLSKFVEEAVNRELLRETMADVSAQNADLSDDELAQLVEEELAETRKTFWATHRR